MSVMNRKIHITDYKQMQENLYMNRNAAAALNSKEANAATAF